MRLRLSWLFSLVLHALLALLVSLSTFAIFPRVPRQAGMEIEIIDRENAMPAPDAHFASEVRPAATERPSIMPATVAAPASVAAPTPALEPPVSTPAEYGPTPKATAAAMAPDRELAPAPVAPARTTTAERPVPHPALQSAMPDLPRTAPATTAETSMNTPAPAQQRHIDVAAIARVLSPTPSPTSLAKPTRLNSAAIGVAIGRAVPKGVRSLTFRERVDLVRLIRSQITPCWNPPSPDEDEGHVTVSLRIRLDQRGTLAGPPVISAITGQTAGNFAYANALAGTVRRAAMRCSPLRLPPELYEAWADIELNFDPKDIT